MRLTFTFTDHPDGSAAPKDQLYHSHFELPDDALNLINVQERIRAVGNLAALHSTASVFLTCKPLDIINHPLKITTNSEPQYSVENSIKVFTIVFDRQLVRPAHRRTFKVFGPAYPQMPDHFFRQKTGNLLRIGGTDWCNTDQERTYAEQIKQLADQLLVLLNAEPVPLGSLPWQCQGFHPFRTDNALIGLQNRRVKAYVAKERKKEKEEAKRLKAQEAIKARGEAPTTIPTTGAGRRPGARPGIYKGVSMRSQLEIRFAAELDERSLRWVYEGEALADVGYLVDFYIPDLKTWVEVKGRFDARDKQTLPDVARFLKQERQERLLVYMQSKAYVVNPSGFREIERSRFWDHLLKV